MGRVCGARGGAGSGWGVGSGRGGAGSRAAVLAGSRWHGLSSSGGAHRGFVVSDRAR